MSKHRKHFTRITQHSLGGCAAVILLVGGTGQSHEREQSILDIDPVVAVQDCRHRIADTQGNSNVGLNPENIRLLNWNVQKVQHDAVFEDLTTFGSDKDLILIQEATLKNDLLGLLGTSRFMSFAPGYRDGQVLTGVMTFSTATPLVRCNLTSHEPWLGTPKAMSVTEYSLRGTSQTLVVINIHAVNFELGIKEFREQLEQIPAVLADHAGPVIVSGDFNTWRQRRMEVVRDVSERVGLTSVTFNDDQRKLAFGIALDHVYVRGLDQLTASTHRVATSDHNPMVVQLSL